MWINNLLCLNVSKSVCFSDAFLVINESVITTAASAGSYAIIIIIIIINYLNIKIIYLFIYINIHKVIRKFYQYHLGLDQLELQLKVIHTVYPLL